LSDGSTGNPSLCRAASPALHAKVSLLHVLLLRSTGQIVASGGIGAVLGKAEAASVHVWVKASVPKGDAYGQLLANTCVSPPGDKIFTRINAI